MMGNSRPQTIRLEEIKQIFKYLKLIRNLLDFFMVGSRILKKKQQSVKISLGAQQKGTPTLKLFIYNNSFEKNNVKDIFFST